jgi:hypothetical protein
MESKNNKKDNKSSKIDAYFVTRDSLSIKNEGGIAMK